MVVEFSEILIRLNLLFKSIKTEYPLSTSHWCSKNRPIPSPDIIITCRTYHYTWRQAQWERELELCPWWPCFSFVFIRQARKHSNVLPTVWKGGWPGSPCPCMDIKSNEHGNRLAKNEVKVPQLHFSTVISAEHLTTNSCKG